MENIFSNPVLVGSAAGVLTSISMLPQLVKIIKEKKSEDISLAMLVILICGLLLWICYGIMKKDWPIIITNSFSVLVNVSILFLSVLYKK